MIWVICHSSSHTLHKTKQQRPLEKLDVLWEMILFPFGLGYDQGRHSPTMDILEHKITQNGWLKGKVSVIPCRINMD